jgi:predicted Zn-dependent peptidase
MKKLMLGLLLCSSLGYSVVVTKEAIEEQKSLTTSFKLKNGIPVIYRQIPGSDIIQVDYSIGLGYKDDPEGKKAVTDIMLSTMPLGAEGWPREKIFATTEKYSTSVSCSEGIELSTCSFSTINEYVDEILPLFAAIIKKPTFTEADTKLIVDQTVAGILADQQDPSRLSNEAVGKVFYGENHPYFMPSERYLGEVKSVSTKDLKENHKKAMSAGLHQIVVVGSLPAKDIQSKLAKYFEDIPQTKVTALKVKDPVFDKNKAYEFIHKPNPTAYISIKTTGPSITDEDVIATDMMLRILDEELGEEIRTKRSLSYGIFSYSIDYSIGIVIISATTSKPKETLEATAEVIAKVKNKQYTKKELDDYRTGYATNYFLTLETHSALARAISSYVHYFGTPDPLYERPRKWDSVTPADIQKMAKKYLKNFRIGVVFDRAKFEDKWATEFVANSTK